MKKSKFLAYILLGCIVFSCTPTNDPRLAIVGVWNFTNIISNIKEVSAAPSSVNKNIAAENIYIQFYSNYNFATNSDISLTKLNLAKRSVFSGTYTNVIENGKDRLLLEFFDSAIGENVSLYFEILNKSSNQPTLFMSKADYIESLRESGTNINSDIGDTFYNFSNRITDASFSLKCSK